MQAMHNRMSEQQRRRGRRQVIRTVAVGGLAALAGCQESDQGREPNETVNDGDHVPTDDTTDGDGDDADQSDGDSGGDPSEARADQLEVIHASGIVSTDAISAIHLTVMKSAGSQTVDLSALTIRYTSAETDTTLTHGGSGDGANTGSTFGSTRIAGEGDNARLTATEDRIRVSLDTAAIEGANGLEPGATATVNFVDSSGVTYTYGVTAPSTFRNKEVVEV